MIDIGKLRKRIAIYARSDAEVFEHSAEITRTLSATVWANAVNVSGTAQVDSRNAGAGITHRFTIRARAGISKANEILYAGWLYRIETIQNQDSDAGRFMVIECNQLCELSTLMDISPEAVTIAKDSGGNEIYDSEGNPIVVRQEKGVIS